MTVESWIREINMERYDVEIKYLVNGKTTYALNQTREQLEVLDSEDVEISVICVHK